MLDIQLFRPEQGGNPEIVRESQRRRYADVSLVDQVIEADSQWRKTRFSLDAALTARGKVKQGLQSGGEAGVEGGGGGGRGRLFWADLACSTGSVVDGERLGGRVGGGGGGWTW